MARTLSEVASVIGIDPTLPRYGTNFMTLQVVLRIGVWLPSYRFLANVWSNHRLP
jgi:hypothetical protein